MVSPVRVRVSPSQELPANEPRLVATSRHDTSGYAPLADVESQTKSQWPAARTSQVPGRFDRRDRPGPPRHDGEPRCSASCSGRDPDGDGELAAGVYGWIGEPAGSTRWGARRHAPPAPRQPFPEAAETEARDRGSSTSGRRSRRTPSRPRVRSVARLLLEVVGTLSDYPAGHSKLLLRKRLSGSLSRR